jgi:hypothetical protein
MKLTRATVNSSGICGGRYIINYPQYDSVEEATLDLGTATVLKLVNQKLFEAKRNSAFATLHGKSPKPKDKTVLIKAEEALLWKERSPRGQSLSSVTSRLRKEKNLERRKELINLAEQLLAAEKAKDGNA